NSHQHYKAIAAPNSTTIFNGVLRVEPHAQQTNAYQRSSNLMLDPASLAQGQPLKPTLRSGKVNAKPELQIFADNVKCSHGANMGKLNTESIFYLQSRGLSFEEAQRMLTLAFAMEIVDQLEDEVIRNKVMAHLDQLEWQ
ncbi:MAG: SufD family Fe-S cluster assembly protein, partial [Bacteroidota bacterium]